MKTIQWLLALIIMFLFIIALALIEHPREIYTTKGMREYQLDVDSNYVDMWDGNRYVGRLKYADDDNLSMMIVHDNQ